MRSPNGLKKGAWTRDEDQKLIAYVTRYGIWNWSQMPKFAGLARSGKSCRLRWMNYLRPDIKLGNFTEEEDETIINLHTLHGNRWSTIAAKLPGRTDNEVKNRWHTHLKKRLNRTQNPTVSTLERQCRETTTNCDEGFEDAEESKISIFDYDLSMTQYMQAEEENSLSSSTETAGGDDISTSGSEETLSDLQSFWRQLYSLETLKMQNHNEAIAELGLNLEMNDEHEDFWLDLSCIL